MQVIVAMQNFLKLEKRNTNCKCSDYKSKTPKSKINYYQCFENRLKLKINLLLFYN